jgi:hypothetical protein
METWNEDPHQKRLAKLIMDGAIYQTSYHEQGKEFDEFEVSALTNGAGWSDEEVASRCVHALSMIRPMVDAPTYRAAHDITMYLHRGYTR